MVVGSTPIRRRFGRCTILGGVKGGGWCVGVRVSFEANTVADRVEPYAGGGGGGGSGCIVVVVLLAGGDAVGTR